jgi:hypothetical protein
MTRFRSLESPGGKSSSVSPNSLRVVGMDDRVDNRFTDRDRRNAPSLAPADTTNVRSMQGVFLDERNRLLDRSDQVCPDLGMVQDPTLVDGLESSGLDPRIRKVLRAVRAKAKHAANGRHSPALIGHHEPQRLQIGPSKASNRRE